MAAALAHQAARAAAGAGTDRDGPGVVEELGDFVVARLAAVVLDRALYRDDAHEVHARVQEGRQHGHAHAGILLEALAEHGVFFAVLFVGKDALHDAGHPDRVVPAELAVHLAAAADACVLELVQLFEREIHVLFRAAGDLLRRAVGLEAHVHHDVAHVVVHDGLEDLVFRVVVGDACVGQTLETDLGRELEYVRSVGHAILSSLVRCCFCCVPSFVYCIKKEGKAQRSFPPFFDFRILVHAQTRVLGQFDEAASSLYHRSSAKKKPLSFFSTGTSRASTLSMRI